ncbi:MAG TPA: RNA 2',3'-cyclic phosphodiesterase [Burkholderiales bacterium]|nr:RNA 2',3'-cyclic phosphodiesterase [Burkholderiales bacterium]
MAESSRLFFAVWPDEVACDKVAVLTERFHDEYGGRPVARDSLHVTLAFLGETPNSRLPDLISIGHSIVIPPFDLKLSRAGCWSGGIFWLAPSEPPPALMSLAATLTEKLQAAAISFDTKRFAPHMTLLRRAGFRGQEMAISPVEFSVSDFVLVHSAKSSAGARYEIVERFPFG